MSNPLTTVPILKSEENAIPLFSKDLIIQDIARYYPQVVEILLEYGLHCVGCHVSGFETLEEGSLGHGMSQAEFANMIADCEEKIAQES